MDLLNITGISNQSFQIWWQIRGIEVRKTCKISAQYLKKLCLLGQKNIGTQVVNTSIIKQKAASARNQPGEWVHGEF